MAEYEMTEAQLAKLMEAMTPVPAIALHCGHSRSAQERANAAWEALGKEMGFRYMTVRPCPYRGDRFFFAEPAPTTTKENTMSTETKPQHSPTPWRLTDEGFVQDAQGHDVDWLYGLPHVLSCVNGTDERTRALVEALEELVACKDTIHPRSPDTGNVPAKDVRAHEKRTAAAWEAARAALALA